MNDRDQQNLLIEIIGQLEEAARHLEKSMERAASFGIDATSENALIEFEALTSRFARAVDILIHKVYRSIDAVEFIDGGTLVDVINRADKRKLIDSVKEMRLLKDIRNDIAHEYIAERIKLLHQEVLERTPKLLLLIERAINYSKKISKYASD